MLGQPPGTTRTHPNFASQAGERLREVTEADTCVWNELDRRVWTQGPFQKDWDSEVGAGEGEGEKMKQRADGSLLGFHL